jgi:hypothetical protein
METFIKGKQQAEGRELEIREESDAEESREDVLEVIEYHESREIEKTIREIEAYWFYCG